MARKKLAAIDERITQASQPRPVPKKVDRDMIKKARDQKFKEHQQAVTADLDEEVERLLLVKAARNQGLEKHREWNENLLTAMEIYDKMLRLLPSLPSDVADKVQLGDKVTGKVTQAGYERNKTAYENGQRRAESLHAGLAKAITHAKNEMLTIAKQGRRYLRAEQGLRIEAINGTLVQDGDAGASDDETEERARDEEVMRRDPTCGGFIAGEDEVEYEDDENEGEYELGDVLAQTKKIRAQAA